MSDLLSCAVDISIHALRGEGDSEHDKGLFYP